MAVTAVPRPLVWDLGCNTGRFSLVAARGAGHVVALDAVAQAVQERFTDLGKRIGDRVGTYSHGMRARLALAQGASHR